MLNEELMTNAKALQTELEKQHVAKKKLCVLANMAQTEIHRLEEDNKTIKMQRDHKTELAFRAEDTLSARDAKHTEILRDLGRELYFKTERLKEAEDTLSARDASNEQILSDLGCELEEAHATSRAVAAATVASDAAHMQTLHDLRSELQAAHDTITGLQDQLETTPVVTTQPTPPASSVRATSDSEVGELQRILDALSVESMH
jgi:chromosome segregation ATPase